MARLNIYVRSLNDHEVSILRTALELLSRSCDPLADYAKTILDQNMHENFMWVKEG